MRTRMVVWTALALVVALAATGWGIEAKFEPSRTSTAVDPAAGERTPWDAPLAGWPGPDGYGYTGQTCTISWVDISATGTLVAGLGDDSFAGPFPIGFSFSFYGTSWTEFYVASNGFVTFGAGDGTYTNQCPLPNSSTPNNMLAILWDDLYPPGGGTVHYQSFGSCPVGSGACLIVQYSNVPFCCPSGNSGIWEGIIFDDGTIRYQYLDVGTGGGISSTEGIENNDAAADYGLTYACNVPGSLSANACIEIGMVPGIALLPNPLEAVGCAGVPQIHSMSLFNNSGAPGTFDLEYLVTGGTASLTGPPSVAADAGAIEPFQITLTPSGPAGAQTVTATVGADGNGYTTSADIIKTVYGTGTGVWMAIATEPDNGRMDNVGAAFDNKVWSITGYGANGNVRTYDPASDSWTTVASSAPPFGYNYARSGCQAAEKVFVYGDAATAGFTGLWSYDMATNTWTALTPTGTPPAQTGIWAPSWVSDPETGYCYMTGGATTPGAGNLTTVYVYDPAANAWLAPLPSFTSVRDFHAAFIFHRASDSHKVLCVVGGNNTNGMTSTQCYDFTSAAWNAENADMGPLPADLWAMGYADKMAPGGQQLWMLGGVLAGTISNSTSYYDVATGSWQDGGPLVTGAVYRTAAANLDSEIYHLGGSIGSFTYTGLADRNLVCTFVDTMPFIDGFESGTTSAWSVVVP